MQNQFVFEEIKEIERLRVQNELLSDYEASVFRSDFFKSEGCAALDIGCNDGRKTVERFSRDVFERVIGVEYNPALAQKAEERYGDGRFSFHSLDVEASDFSERLREIMQAQGVSGFDVIYLSFLLMHLFSPQRLLTLLKPFLKADGRLLIVEANDGASTLSNDGCGLLGAFLEILKKDKYSGNRELGATICDTLSASGYENVCVWHDAVCAGVGERKKKKAIFTTFFSYLPEDIAILLEAEPENEEYRAWRCWIDRHYRELERLILERQSVISMGIKIVTCTKGTA